MSYNSSTGIVYIDTSTNPDTGVSIGDVGQALSRSDSDLGLLCSDKKWESNSLVRMYRTNPMAKYKPVRHDSLDPLTVAERASTRYGFGDALPPILSMAQNVPQNDWVYLPPRGKGQGTGGANEWFRLLDFNGYATFACAPLAMITGQFVYDGTNQSEKESQILLFGDGMSNAIRTDGHRWASNESLSLYELLHADTGQGIIDLSGYYISFLLVDKTDYAKNMIVTGMTLEDFITNEYSYYTFPIYAQEETVSGITYPTVPIMSYSRRGHTFEIIVCLLPGNNPQPGSGHGYEVYTDSTTVTVLSLSPYSLGFTAGCDRVEATLSSGAFKLDGTTITSVNVNYVDMTTEMTYQGNTYRAFMVEVRAILDTTQAGAWVGAEKGISGNLTLSNSGGFPFGAPPNGDNPITIGVATTVASSLSGQNKAIYSTDDAHYLWIMKYNGSLLPTTVTASLTLDYPLDTPISNIGTKAIT